MTLYVVTCFDRYDVDNVVGIYSSYQEAVQQADRHDARRKVEQEREGFGRYDYYEVTPYLLNKTYDTYEDYGESERIINNYTTNKEFRQQRRDDDL